MQGNCSAPTTQTAERMGLPEASVAGMQEMLPGQCVVVLDSSWLHLKEGNKWLDNLHVVIAPDKIVPQISCGIDCAMSNRKYQHAHPAPVDAARV